MKQELCSAMDYFKMLEEYVGTDYGDVGSWMMSLGLRCVGKAAEPCSCTHSEPGFRKLLIISQSTLLQLFLGDVHGAR